MTSTLSKSPLPFVLDSIVKTSPPSGCEGQLWCKYVIVQGDNVIEGMRRGGPAEVADVVDALIVQLNERRGGKKRGYQQRTADSGAKPA
ncbi:MAG: hypothetical protein AAF184_09500 [Pseudomonadota bacterium]